MLSYAPVCRPCPKSLPWFLLSSLVLPFTFIWWSCFPFHWKTKTKQTTAKHFCQPQNHTLTPMKYPFPDIYFCFCPNDKLRLFHVRPSPLIANQIPSLLPIHSSLTSYFLSFSHFHHFSPLHFIIWSSNQTCCFISHLKKCLYPNSPSSYCCYFSVLLYQKTNKEKWVQKVSYTQKLQFLLVHSLWIHSNSTLTISTPPELLLLKLLRTLFLSYSTAQQYLTQLITPSC